MPGLSIPLSRLSRQVGPSALEGFEDEGLIRLDDSAQRSGLVVGGRAQKPMPPAKSRRRMNAAKLGGLRQTLARDHRPGVIGPALLLAQMRHRRLGERVERAPATLAAKPQQPVRAAPADDRSARAMRTALAFHPLPTGGPKRILPTTALAAPLRRGFRSLVARRICGPNGRPRQRRQTFGPLRRAQAGNRSQPRRKSSARIESTSRPTPSISKTNRYYKSHN